MEDRILDTAIALELLYDLGSSELSYKLRMRAEHFLADTASARVDICNQLQDFYDASSVIVHGKKTSKKKPKVPNWLQKLGLALPRRRSKGC